MQQDLLYLQIKEKFSTKGLMDDKDGKLNLSYRVATLNPNAAEFIPSTLKSTVGKASNADGRSLGISGDSVRTFQDQSKSDASNNSDDEVHEYWRRKLPDDITPDFKFMEEDDLRGHGHLSLASLSIHDCTEASRFSASASGQTLGTHQKVSPLSVNNFSLSEKLGCSGSTYSENQSSAAFMFSDGNSWDENVIDGNHHLNNKREWHHCDGDSSDGFLNDLIGDHDVTKGATISPLEFLTSQFPAFAAESLGSVYYANGCNLNLTIEMLTQLELQVDGGFSQNQNSKALTAPSFNALDFPMLPVTDAQNGLPTYIGEDLQQDPSTDRSLSSLSRCAMDFASTVKKNASLESGRQNCQRKGSSNENFGSSSSQLSYNGREAFVVGDKLPTPVAPRAAPVWLETGEAVANIYSQTREEARNFACIRNALFEQACEAYVIGNRALAKELSAKGQMYNMKMKEAHNKARETIYRQRNPSYTKLRQNKLIDLHGLHVSEAIHMLKQELGVLRQAARCGSIGKPMQVMICVGTGHHTKGSRTPARLPVAVEQYLINEGLRYTEPQPGLLCVVL